MLETLDQWALAQGLRRSVYLYPLVNALHVAALGVLVTSAGLMDARILGMGRRVPLADVLALLRPIAMAALAIAALSGGLLFVVRPQAYAANPVFLVKMGLLALALANAGAFVLTHRHHVPHALLTRAMAAASLLLWLAVLLAGRLIGYFGME